MRNLRKFGILLLTLVFTVSFAMAIWTQLDYSSASRTYSEAAKIAGQSVFSTYTPVLPNDTEAVLLSAVSENPTADDIPSEKRLWDSYAQSLFTMDLDALRSENPDVIGWIMIPETNISYPLLQGSDNAYYLDHSWNGDASFAGSIFLETQNTPDLKDHNTILYGHNLKNATMFTQLHKFRDQSFWENHRHVYIITPEGIRRYEIFAAYEAPVNGPTFWLNVDTDDLKQQLIGEAAQLSVLDTGITPTTDEKILTLSTCTGYTYDRRWVVKARFEGFVIQDQAQEDVKHFHLLAG